MFEQIAELVYSLDHEAGVAFLQSVSRREEMRGRDALSELLGKVGSESENPHNLQMPQTSYSLTHSGEVAVAIHARIDSGAYELAGTGVDFEQSRIVNPRAARFFLQPDEQHWVEALQPGQRNRQLLRLWTVKEALFKADITNRIEDRFPGQYELTQPALLSGFAKHASLKNICFIYTTIEMEGGIATAAIALRRH